MAAVPNVKKTDYGQQEAIAAMGGEMRAWGVDTLEVLLDKKGAAAGLRVVDLDWSAGKPERIAGSEHEVPAQLVLIACGFTGPEHGVFDAVGVPVATAGRPLPVMAAEARTSRHVLTTLPRTPRRYTWPVTLVTAARSW